MSKTNFLYLFLDFISVAFPFAFSFYPKANFSKKWKYLWRALLIPASIFIVWDMAFTRMGVWGFNPKYLLGIYIYNLPIEEILFFICIPYACVFLYEALRYLVKKDFFESAAPSVTIMLIMFLLTLGLLNLQRWYTGVTFLSTAIFLGLLQWKWKAPFLGRFYFAFIFVLVPFFIVNGILTGSFIDEPVVWYNAKEMLGLRMGTIPFEDTFYGMLLLLMNVALFERGQLNESQFSK
ncbi:MAG TPA: lycopene cyclase domain-containing protein [Cytophagales bacterium]|jgi:lycopene cyclase domain-containing protein|nr:lycopene cyclase domain-containing protein [Cytophagales bacterium]